MTNAQQLLAETDADQLYLKACELQGYQPLTLDQFSHLPENQRRASYSTHRVWTVIEAGKEGKKLDYNNYAEDKRYPWWDMETYGDEPAGSGFRLHFVYCARTGTYVGARLSSFDGELAQHIAEVMKEDYRNFIKE